jgi:Protein of unknown function (DUF3489)
MTNTKKVASTDMAVVPTKHQQVVDLLKRDGGATLDEMATLANWLPHSTRAFMTGLRKKGHVVDSTKIDAIRRYRITTSAA